jgi:hypothetical protein
VFAVEVKQYRAHGHKGIVIVPAVYGRTATASVKATPRSGGPDREVRLSRSVPATHEILRRVDALANDVGLVVQETPSGAILKTQQGQTVATVFLDKWNALDVPLQPLRDRGFDAEVAEMLADLRSVASKKLSEKVPELPTVDVAAEWPKVRAVLVRSAMLHSSS